MAHFAQLDENNVVTQVIVVNNNELLDNGVESEAKGIVFCKSLFGEDTRWVQTSYNNNFRKRYAGIKFLYRSDLNVFLPPSPYPSWAIDEVTAEWTAPVPYPQDGNLYKWDEDTLSWVLVYEVP